jgi:hypothetical protein
LEGQLDATTPVIIVKLKPDTVNAEAVGRALANKYGVKVEWYSWGVFRNRSATLL